MLSLILLWRLLKPTACGLSGTSSSYWNGCRQEPLLTIARLGMMRHKTCADNQLANLMH